MNFSNVHINNKISLHAADPIFENQLVPEVSVAISTYNHGQYIEQTILSALAQQTSFRFEIVIADDQSNDGTTAICKHYEGIYPAIIRVLDNEFKYGQSKNLERAVQHSRGKYIAYCEGDDYFTDLLKLQRQFDFMEKHSDVTVCFHRIVSVDEMGHIIEQQNIERTPVIYESEKLIHLFAPTPSLFFRKNAVDFPPEFHEVKSTDAFLFALLADKGKGADLGFIGAAYRKHPDGLFNRMNKLDRYEQTLHTRLKMKEAKIFSPEIHKEIKRELHRREWVYLKAMIKDLKIKELFKLTFFILRYRLKIG